MAPEVNRFLGVQTRRRRHAPSTVDLRPSPSQTWPARLPEIGHSFSRILKGFALGDLHPLSKEAGHLEGIFNNLQETNRNQWFNISLRLVGADIEKRGYRVDAMLRFSSTKFLNHLDRGAGFGKNGIVNPPHLTAKARREVTPAQAGGGRQAVGFGYPPASAERLVIPTRDDPDSPRGIPNAA
jgi:hypothetical protein